MCFSVNQEEEGYPLSLAFWGCTNKAMTAAIIRRAVAVRATLLCPETICSAVTPCTQAPNAATPIAPPPCLAAFRTAEAVPELERSTLDKMTVAIAGPAS